MIWNIYSGKEKKSPVSPDLKPPLEHFFLTVGQNNFGNKVPFQSCFPCFCLNKNEAITLVKSL